MQKKGPTPQPFIGAGGGGVQEAFLAFAVQVAPKILLFKFTAVVDKRGAAPSDVYNSRSTQRARFQGIICLGGEAAH